MIIDKLIDFKMEVVKRGGKIIRITLDKEGNKQLRNELPDTETSHSKMILGIVIDQIKECPTCGQNIKEKENG